MSGTWWELYALLMDEIIFALPSPLSLLHRSLLFSTFQSIFKSFVHLKTFCNNQYFLRTLHSSHGGNIRHHFSLLHRNFIDNFKTLHFAFYEWFLSKRLGSLRSNLIHDSRFVVTVVYLCLYFNRYFKFHQRSRAIHPKLLSLATLE